MGENKLSKLSMKKLVGKYSKNRASEKSLLKLAEILEDITISKSLEAKEVSKNAKRSTIKKSDLKIVFS